MTTTQLQRLIALANTNDAASLDALARALQRAGYGARLIGAADLRVTFNQSESSVIEEGWEGSFDDAQALLAEAAKHAPKGGAYNKTWFTMTAPNGDTYNGRLDITTRYHCLRKHVAAHCRGVTDPNAEGWVKVVYDDDARASCAEWLEVIER